MWPDAREGWLELNRLHNRKDVWVAMHARLTRVYGDTVCELVFGKTQAFLPDFRTMSHEVNKFIKHIENPKLSKLQLVDTNNRQ